MGKSYPGECADEEYKQSEEYLTALKRHYGNWLKKYQKPCLRDSCPKEKTCTFRRESTYG